MTNFTSVAAAILVLLLDASHTIALNTTWFCDYPVEDVPTQKELLDHLMEEYYKNSSTSFYPEIGFFREKYTHISSCVNHDHLTLSIYDIEEGGIPKAPMPRLWPSRHIPFLIDDHYPHKTAERIRADMSGFSNSTCIRFVDRTDEKVYIRFVHPSNNATIKRLPVYSDDESVAAPSDPGEVHEEVEGKEPGYSGKMRTFLRTDTDIVTRDSGVMPTLMFILGFKREELRQDRDEYIGFTFQPRDTKKREMFQKELVTDFDLRWPYDTQSVTHISFKEAEDLNVGLESVDNDVFPIKMRGDNFLSEGDIKKINDLYCQSAQEALPQDLVTPVGNTLGPDTFSTATSEPTAGTSPSGGLGRIGVVTDETVGSGDKVLELQEVSSGEGSGVLPTEALEVEGSGEEEQSLESGAVGDERGAATVGPVPAIISSTETPSTSTAAPTPVPTTTTRSTTQGVFIDNSSSDRPRVSATMALAVLLAIAWGMTSQAGGN